MSFARLSVQDSHKTSTMADREAQREQLYCHACAHDWYRDERGLECPNCHAGAVEFIDQNNDPRNNRIDLTNDSDNGIEERSRSADALPQHPLHHHNPWANDAPDPEEEDIEHVTFDPVPGIHIHQTTYRSPPPPGQGFPDAFAPIFSSFAGMLNNGGAPRPGSGGPRSPFPPPFHQQFHANHNHPPILSNPMQPPNPPRVPINVHVFGAGDQSFNSIHAIMQTMLTSLQENSIHANNDPHAQHRGQLEGNPFNHLMQTLAQFHDPAGAAHGDAVFTDEAMDRIISQMMEQQGSAGSAPGPATAAAIAALPKKQADKDMVGTDGKAECSVCMDAVLLGDEVTVLPCKHWFHGDCVGAWLKEHDTCPHCRQGIMPKDGPADASSPRSPGQSPRQSQNPWGYGGGGSSNPPGGPQGILTPGQIFGTAQRMARPPPQAQASRQGRQVIPPMQPWAGEWTQPGMQHPYVPGGYPDYPEPRDYVQPPPAPHSSSRSYQPPTSPTPLDQSRRQSSSRRSSHGSGNGEGGSNGSPSSRIGGWWRNLRGGSSAEQR